MTRQEYIEYLEKTSNCRFEYMQYENVLCPSMMVGDWELRKKDENSDTEARIQYLETKIIQLQEEINSLNFSEKAK